MTFATWWAGKYASNKRISEATFDLLRDAYEQGAKDEREGAEIRAKSTPAYPLASQSAPNSKTSTT